MHCVACNRELDGEFKRYVGGRWFCLDCAKLLGKAVDAAEGKKAPKKVILKQVSLKEVDVGAAKPDDVVVGPKRERKGLRGR